jgi:hypothetical protein
MKEKGRRPNLGTHQKGRQEKTGHSLKDGVYCHDLHNGDTPN